MNLIDQLFATGLEVRDDEAEVLFRLKKQPTQADYNDLSILAYKGLDEFLGNDKLQAHLAVQAANIEHCEFGGDMIDFETEGFITMKSAVTTLFTTIRDQLRELKKSNCAPAGIH